MTCELPPEVVCPLIKLLTYRGLRKLRASSLNVLYNPNSVVTPDCPFIEKVGKPAEYSNGVIVCSDCGSPLTDKEIVANPYRTRTFGNLDKRLLYAIIALWFICGNLTWLSAAYF